MIKKLAKSVGQYKGATVAAPLFVTLEVVIDVLIPLLMAYIIDKGIDAGNVRVILITGALLIVASALSLLFGYLSGKYAAKASAGFAANLRKNMFFNVQNFSFSNIDKFSTSSIVTRLTTDVTNVQNAFQLLIRVAVRAPLMLIFSLVMAFTVQTTIAFVFLAIVPILGIALAVISVKAHPYFKRVFNTYDDLNNVVQENLNGIRDVKNYVREDHEIKKFNKVSESIYKDFSKAQKIVAFNAPVMQFAVYLCILLLSWLGAKFVVGGSMTTGSISTMLAYAMQILMSLMMLSMILVMIIISRESAQRITELLDEKSDLKSPENAVKEVSDGSVEFDGVSFSYVKDPNNCSLSDVDLKIRSGETVGILGGTGSSKTSLVQLIPRLYDATVGSVKLGGVDVKDYDLEVLRENVAMVLQKNVLFSGTIRDNLKWGDPNATDEDLDRVCRLAKADEFIKTFPDGYDTYIEQGGTNVSGGQKQRLCIARALLKNPKVLILDDSTSAVDTRTDASIRRAFKEDIPDVTKIIIAQRVSSVQDADKIIILDGGRIVGAGSHEELLKSSEIYREVYESQQKGGNQDEKE